jgi:hypothetical protein
MVHPGPSQAKCHSSKHSVTQRDGVQHDRGYMRRHNGDQQNPMAGLGFYRPARVPAIPATVVNAESGSTWRDVVAGELTRPFDTSIAPMIRVMLRSRPSSPAAIVLTVDHAIVDGVSAGYILRDLFSALNGHELAALPVPPSQEKLIGRLRDAQPAAANGQPPQALPEWLATRSKIRPFDGALPRISAVCFDEDLTWRLVTRARAEQTTVHSALVSAMTRVIFESGRNEFVRMTTPCRIPPPYRRRRRRVPVLHRGSHSVHP